MFVYVFGRRLIVFQVSGDERIAQGLRDFVRLLERSVEQESQLRNEFEMNVFSDSTPQKPAGAAERRDYLRLPSTAERYDEGRCLAQVRAHPHFCNGDRRIRELRIADLAALEDPRQRVTHFFADPKLPLTDW
jgi:hypothetical protein